VEEARLDFLDAGRDIDVEGIDVDRIAQPRQLLPIGGNFQVC
jgi:hypothetical protein